MADDPRPTPPEPGAPRPRLDPLAVVAALLLALATYLHVDPSPERIGFHADVVVQLEGSLDVIDGGALPLLGPRVAAGDVRVDGHLRSGPAAFYLGAPVLALGGGVAELGRFTAVLASLATAIWTLLGWSGGRPLRGLLAGAFHAFHPILAEWARIPYHQGFVPFLVALAAACIAFAVAATDERARRWRAALAGLAVGLATHGYAVALGFVPALPLALLLLRRRVDARTLAAYGAGCVLAYAPWLLHELRAGAPQLRALAGLVAGATPPLPGAEPRLGFLDMLVEVSRPALVYAGGFAVGGLAVLRERVAGGAAPRRARAADEVAVVALAAVLGWLAFLWIVCAPSPVFGSTGDWSRFFLPGLGPAALLAAVGACTVVERVAGEAPGWTVRRAAVTALVAAVSAAAIAGRLGPRHVPHWATGSTTTLDEVERYRARVVRELGFVPGRDWAQLAYRWSPIPDGAEMVRAAAVLERIERRRGRGGPPPPLQAPVLVVGAVRDCSGTQVDEPRFEEHLVVRRFDDCASFERWSAIYRERCRARGHELRVGTADGSAVACGLTPGG